MSVVYISPIASRSGYGDCSREVGEFLLNKYNDDVSIISTRWGNSSLSELDDGAELSDRIKSRMVTKLPNTPDIVYQMSLPSEFNPVGGINIGITAGLEFLGWPDEFIHGCNRMNKVIVPSQFTHDALLNNKHNSVECSVELDIIHESIDEIYTNNTITTETEIHSELDSIQEEFCFLTMGVWSPDNDRKNIISTIKTFQHTFSNTNHDVALVLKVNGSLYNTQDIHRIKNIVSSLKQEYTNPKSVYIIYGNLTPVEIHNLYKHPRIKCMLSLTHGEGFGRPLLEASVSTLPIIASNWSGHLDFLPKHQCQLVSGSLGIISETNPYKTNKSIWFYPDEQLASHYMLECFTQYDIFKKRATELSSDNNVTYNKNKMFKLYETSLNNI